MSMEHSLLFPLPFGIHVGFVIISVIMLILCYAKRKYTYELYMLIGIASTMFVYICSEKPMFYILGLEEMILLGLTIADMVKVSRANAAKETAREAAQTADISDDSSDREESADE